MLSTQKRRRLLRVSPALTVARPYGSSISLTIPGVLEAAAELGIEDDDIKDMRAWDGKEDILDMQINSEGRWEPRNTDRMEEDYTAPTPTTWHKSIPAMHQSLGTTHSRSS